MLGGALRFCGREPSQFRSSHLRMLSFAGCSNATWMPSPIDASPISPTRYHRKRCTGSLLELGRGSDFGANSCTRGTNRACGERAAEADFSDEGLQRSADSCKEMESTEERY